MNDKRTLSIIVPCYNEERTVGVIAKRLVELSIGDWNKEIIIVNDGSTDGSAEALKNVPTGVKVITLEKNSGKGTAVITALGVAKGDYAVIQDADLECDPADIPKLLTALEGRKGVQKISVIGSRETHPDNPKKFALSRFGSLFITLLINVLYGTNLTDTMMGYKLFPRAAFPLFKIGGFDSEMLFLIGMLEEGYTVVEVPVSYKPRDRREGKKIKYHHGINIVLQIVLFRMKGILNRLKLKPKQ